MTRWAVVVRWTKVFHLHLLHWFGLTGEEPVCESEDTPLRSFTEGVNEKNPNFSRQASA